MLFFCVVHVWNVHYHCALDGGHVKKIECIADVEHLRCFLFRKNIKYGHFLIWDVFFHT